VNRVRVNRVRVFRVNPAAMVFVYRWVWNDIISKRKYRSVQAAYRAGVRFVRKYGEEQ